ncbi:MAG: Na+/H+ antiporter [Chitinophagaceae bacterium]
MFVILFIVMLADKIKLAAPILLVIAGLPLGFVPALHNIHIDPELIFVIFLPPLLYEAAWNTSWKDLWKWRRLVSSFAFLIVIVTSCVIAFAAKSIIPGFTLATGFLLGGIISPPDAVAASNVLKNIKVPKRFVTIVEGESLLNDATSLVIFRFALAAVSTGEFVFHKAALSFVLVIVLGIAVGVGVAIIFYAIHRWLPTTTNIDIILTFITPYAMYMAAEAFHFSGVLAVVSGGLYLSARRQSMLSHRSRLQGINVWQAVAFVLNSFVFILIGLEFPVIIQSLGQQGTGPAIKYSLLITAILILTRLASTYGATGWTIFISRYIKVADPSPGWKAPLLFGWTGMRGVVSLAAALSIPVALHNGSPFPQRNLILFITFTVIIVTLVLQGLTLPSLVKWVNMPDPDLAMPDSRQTQLIRKKLAAAAVKLLNDKYAAQLEKNNMVKALHQRMQSDMAILDEKIKAEDQKEQDKQAGEYRLIMLDLLKEQRTLLLNLNKKETVHDDIIRQQLELLDLEEEKIRRHYSVLSDEI